SLELVSPRTTSCALKPTMSVRSLPNSGSMLVAVSVGSGRNATSSCLYMTPAAACTSPAGISNTGPVTNASPTIWRTVVLLTAPLVMYSAQAGWTELMPNGLIASPQSEAPWSSANVSSSRAVRDTLPSCNSTFSTLPQEPYTSQFQSSAKANGTEPVMPARICTTS